MKMQMAVNDKKDNENTDNSNNKVTDNEGVADDATIDNGDTMSEGTDNDNVPNNYRRWKCDAGSW